MADTTNGFQAVVEGYFAVWNETDAEKRRALIASVWAEDATYTDPMGDVCGHEGINAFVEAVRERFAGVRFRQVGTLDAHHDRVRFAWEAGIGDGSPVAGGLDVAQIRDGKLQSVIGFVDFAPTSEPTAEGGNL